MANCNDTEIIEIAKRYTGIVKKELNISHVYLFGSYVKGNYSNDSDIDILLIGEGFTGDLVDDTYKLMKLRRKIDKRIEPHPIKSSDFKETNQFFKEVIETGIRIM